MTHTIPDLWPADVIVSTIIAPVTILRQQAGLLGQRTKNLVEADVRSKPSTKTDHFAHDFYLVAPALDNYQILLFTTVHSISLYPVTLEGRKDTIEAKSEEEFFEALKKIFADEDTKRIISALISQSQA